jgi:hypothetical protein
MKKVILFAAGGGNDIFSTIAFSKAHLSGYEKTAFVSILGLTPFHTELPIKNEPNIELPLLKPNHRYIINKEIKEITCMEKFIPEFTNDNYICVSPKYSPHEQASNLQKLFDEWNMTSEDTEIKVVDFGGDILTNGKQKSIISPELDAYTLCLVDALLGYKKELLVCFPGCDGELPADYLSKCCSTAFKQLIDLNLWHKHLSIIHEKLSKYRTGNTVPNMLKIVSYLLNRTSDHDIVVKKGYTVGCKKYEYQIEVNLDWSLQSYVYCFSLPYKANIYQNIFDNKEYNLLNVFKELLAVYDGSREENSDFYLQYLYQDDNMEWSNKFVHPNKTTIMLIDIYTNKIQLKTNVIDDLKSYDILFTSICDT